MNHLSELRDLLLRDVWGMPYTAANLAPVLWPINTARLPLEDDLVVVFA